MLEVTIKSIDDLSLSEIRHNAKPCPFCGSLNLRFDYTIILGGISSGFAGGRIICDDCTGSKGNVCDYGTPTDIHKIKAYLQWNDRSDPKLKSEQ